MFGENQTNLAKDLTISVVQRHSWNPFLTPLIPSFLLSSDFSKMVFSLCRWMLMCLQWTERFSAALANADIGWRRVDGGSRKCWHLLTKGRGGSDIWWQHWKNAKLKKKQLWNCIALHCIGLTIKVEIYFSMCGVSTGRLCYQDGYLPTLLCGDSWVQLRL